RSAAAPVRPSPMRVPRPNETPARRPRTRNGTGRRAGSCPRPSQTGSHPSTRHAARQPLMSITFAGPGSPTTTAPTAGVRPWAPRVRGESAGSGSGLRPLARLALLALLSLLAGVLRLEELAVLRRVRGRLRVRVHRLRRLVLLREATRLRLLRRLAGVTALRLLPVRAGLAHGLRLRRLDDVLVEQVRRHRRERLEDREDQQDDAAGVVFETGGEGDEQERQRDTERVDRRPCTGLLLAGKHGEQRGQTTDEQQGRQPGEDRLLVEAHALRGVDEPEEQV